MPVLVNCPSCNGPLRIADSLLGRKVRCPACRTVFDAAAPPPESGGEGLPLETQRIDSWKQLDLELARDPAPQPPPPPPPSPRSEPAPRESQSNGSRPLRGLVGAVEVDAGPQDPPRRPTPARDEPPPSSRRGDDQDRRTCPTCERSVSRDSTRCYNCGERLAERDRSRDDRRDSRRRGDFYRDAPRRDSEPHRGGVVLTLGIVSLVCLMGFCVYGITCAVGLVLGVIGWWMGQADLAKMKAGSMDPEGHSTTQAGWICSIIGTFLNLLVVLGCGAIVAFAIIDTTTRSQMNQRPGFQPQQPPPPIKAPGPMPGPKPGPMPGPPGMNP